LRLQTSREEPDGCNDQQTYNNGCCFGHDSLYLESDGKTVADPTEKAREEIVTSITRMTLFLPSRPEYGTEACGWLALTSTWHFVA
jgi:hypothetical protein